MTAEQAAEILTASYQVEVECRGRTCDLDQPTRQHIDRMAHFLTDPADTHYGVMLIGGIGNGKTTMMYALQRAMWFVNRTKPYETQRDWQMIIRGARHVTEDDRWPKCLGIDDLGLEPLEKMSFGTIVTPSSDVLYHRYEKRLFTIVTTNLALQPNSDGVSTIRQRYGDRLADRFKEQYIIIPFHNPSYR